MSFAEKFYGEFSKLFMDKKTTGIYTKTDYENIANFLNGTGTTEADIQTQNRWKRR
jgi:hypothetical protein